MNPRLALLPALLVAASASAQRPKSPTAPPVKSPARSPARAATPSARPAATAAPLGFAMKNGMKVTLLHVGTAARTAVALVLETGEIDEPAFGPGLASLTANMLLEGTVARSAQQIRTEVASLGATLDVRSGPVTTTLSGEMETARVPRFLSLIADLVRHPLLDTASFGRVRRNALRALDSTMQNPTDLARRQWRAIIFPDGPFGHPYSFATTLNSLQLGHVRNVYDDNYSASRAHLYVSGAFDAAAMERSIRNTFGDWPSGLAEKPVAVHATTVHELVVVDRPGANRSVTWIGLPTIDPSDPGYVKLEVADMLLSGSDSSRVAIDVAALEGAHSHGSSNLWQRRGAAYWVDEFDVRTENTGLALGALIGELNLLRQTAPTEAEVARARARVIAAFDERERSRSGRIGLMELMDENALGDDWRTSYVRRVMAVTPEDVRYAVTTYLEPKRMAIAVVGDRGRIEPELAKLRPMVP